MSTVQYGPNDSDYVILLEDVQGDEPDDLEGQMLCAWAFDVGLKWTAEIRLTSYRSYSAGYKNAKAMYQEIIIGRGI